MVTCQRETSGTWTTSCSIWIVTLGNTLWPTQLKDLSFLSISLIVSFVMSHTSMWATLAIKKKYSRSRSSSWGTRSDLTKSRTFWWSWWQKPCFLVIPRNWRNFTRSSMTCSLGKSSIRQMHCLNRRVRLKCPSRLPRTLSKPFSKIYSRREEDRRELTLSRCSMISSLVR